MSANIKYSVDTCSNCHQVKLVQHKPHGQLEPLSPAASLFSKITIDFISNLLPYNWQGKVFNSILVLVDRYTKIAMYILSKMDWETKIMANVVAETLL